MPVGDPHFTGIDGQHYDVMGEPGKHYCIISAPTFQLNARFSPHGEFTIIDQLGLKFPGTGLFFDLSLEWDKMVVWMNHSRILWHASFDTGLRDSRGRLIPGGIQVLDRRAVVHTGHYVIEVVRCDDHGEPHPKFGRLTAPHLDTYLFRAFSDGPVDPPHGLLGVSARGRYTPAPGGEQGEGVLDVLEPGSTYRDYEVPDLWSPAFKFNQYRW